MNKVILHGNCGKDPETRTVNEKTVCKFSLATSKTFTNGSGEKITGTQWHNIQMWGKLAETASKYVKKGSSLIIEGEINYRTYEKDGHTVYTTDIIADRMHFTGKKEDSKPETNEGKYQKSGKVSVNSMSDISELPGNVANYDEIPDDNELPIWAMKSKVWKNFYTDTEISIPLTWIDEVIWAHTYHNEPSDPAEFETRLSNKIKVTIEIFSDDDDTQEI